MAQIGRSSSRRPQLVGWLVGFDEKSIFGTEKKPEGRAQVLVASFKSNLVLFQRRRFVGQKKPPEGAPTRSTLLGSTIFLMNRPRNLLNQK